MIKRTFFGQSFYRCHFLHLNKQQLGVQKMQHINQRRVILMGLYQDMLQVQHDLVAQVDYLLRYLEGAQIATFLRFCSIMQDSWKAISTKSIVWCMSCFLISTQDLLKHPRVSQGPLIRHTLLRVHQTQTCILLLN